MHPEARNQPYIRAINECPSITNVASVTHTQTIPTGPAGIEYASVEAIEGRRPMIEKAMPKTSIKVKFRRNSCLYPSFALSIVSLQ